MLLKSLVFADVPSSTREKFERGSGDPSNGNDVGPVTSASLMIVIEAGKMTAPADRERSWFPPVPSRSTSRMWYGEPEIDTAELSRPQFWRVAMCPSQASTGFETLVVKVIEMQVVLSPE